MLKLAIRFLVFTFIIAFIAGCYPTKNVQRGEYLLVKSDYKIKTGKIKKHSISSQLTQKPNKKIFFYRFYLNAYDFGTNFRDSSFLYRLFAENIGEPPVIYDSNEVDATGQNIKRHLNNLGYYNSHVSVRIKTWDALKIAKLQYLIDAGQPYKIRNINYEIPQNDIRRFVQADLSNSHLHKGMNFSVETLEDERDRIVDALNNTGYYYFVRNQITFDADTNLNTFEVDLTLRIMPLISKTSTVDSTIYLTERRYIINHIYITYNLLRTDLSKVEYDTTIITAMEDENVYQYHFLHSKTMKVNTKTIIDALFIKPGKYYKKRDIVESYKALTALNAFRYINLELEDISDPNSLRGNLLCYISIIDETKFSFTSNSEVKNTGGDFGLEQVIGLRSRNTLRHAELLNLSLHGAMEMQSQTNVSNTSKWPFNVYEAGINASMDFPRFIAPIKSFKGNRYLRPKTNIKLGYNYQKRPDYTRYILNSSFGYTWQPRPRYFNSADVIDISSVKIYPSTQFQQIIDNYTDPRIIYSYRDHLVLSSSLSFTYSEQRYKGLKPFGFLFAAIDAGGHLWNLIPRAIPGNRDSSGQVILFNLPSAEYVKVEADGRYYVPAGKNVMNVFRAFIGIGLPYGSSKALPFEKSFYIGGANSLRAWSIGTLGPGSYNSNATTFEMTGDIKLEFNYELRFPISGGLEVGLFSDLGNIWLLNRSDAQTGGEFKFSTFIPQMALDFGYGLRYDLDFLIIRFDIAHPLYQPYFPKGSRWSSTNQEGDIQAGFNFAIGYPF